MVKSRTHDAQSDSVVIRISGRVILVQQLSQDTFKGGGGRDRESTFEKNYREKKHTHNNAYLRAKTSCTMALTTLKGRSFCWIAGMDKVYCVPSTLNFEIRLLTVATRLYGNRGFAITHMGPPHH